MAKYINIFGENSWFCQTGSKKCCSIEILIPGCSQWGSKNWPVLRKGKVTNACIEWWLPQSFSIMLQSTRFGHHHEVTVVPVIIVWPIIIIFRCLLTRGSPMGRQEACADCAEIIWESWRQTGACLKSQKLFLCCSTGCCSTPDIPAPAWCPPASHPSGQALLSPLSLIPHLFCFLKNQGLTLGSQQHDRR